MMRNNETYVAGVGIHSFGDHPQLGLLDLAAVAVREALSGAGLDLREIEEVFVGNALGSPGGMASVAEGLGIAGIPVTRIEQACASGSTALRLACEAVSSGRRRSALALGVEKMTGGVLQLDPAPGYHSRLGLDVLPLLYALKARQYMASSGATLEDLASIAAKAHRLGALAPHAYSQKASTIGEIVRSPMIADPITRLQCCRNADGAAAAVITSRPGQERIRLAGWVGGIAIEDPAAPMTAGWDSRERVVRDLARALYEASGIGPEDIDIVQVNDAFTVAEPLYLEALGFAKQGDGIGLHRDGSTAPGGRLPTNTDGGLIGRAHSLGATGLAMLYEIWTQLAGRAGSRQAGTRLCAGLIQSHGYGGENIFVMTK